MKKILIRVAIALVVLILLVVVTLGLFLDRAIKSGVETVGPKLAGVSVRLDGVHVALLSGSGKIKGLLVGNPEGYKTPHAISVGSASVALQPGSLLSDKIVIRSIRVESPEIIFEGGLRGNNLSQIRDNLNAALGGAADSASKPSASESEKPPRKLQVDELLITGAKVKVSLKGTGGFATPVALPDIHFTNLGQGPEGITPAELARKVLAALTEGALKAAAGTVTDIGKGAVEAATGAGKEATEQVEKTAKGITDLFKKKK
ncbi:MAG: AsmA family protein [Verrucomicrobiales bacterium]|nr:AsmA family protein [Verrucomicrobiales bacterium]